VVGPAARGEEERELAGGRRTVDEVEAPSAPEGRGTALTLVEARRCLSQAAGAVVRGGHGRLGQTCLLGRPCPGARIPIPARHGPSSRSRRTLPLGGAPAFYRRSRRGRRNESASAMEGTRHDAGGREGAGGVVGAEDRHCGDLRGGPSQLNSTSPICLDRWLRSSGSGYRVVRAEPSGVERLGALLA
jgi:hypothetical protein